MNDPVLEYESAKSATLRPRSEAGCLFAVLSLLAGSTLAYVFAVGFGLGDTWVIAPHPPLYWWLLPASLMGWPVWFFARSAAR
jgi:hypothetical protein